MNATASVTALQLLVFEMNWPTYRWIKRVLMHDGPTVCLYAQHAECPPPDSDRMDACTKMFHEIFQAVYEQRKALKVEYGFELPSGQGWEVLMSDEVFKRLATEVAPWRLEAGR